jgi:hypothetical protein
MARRTDVRWFTQVERNHFWNVVRTKPIGMVVPKPMHKNLRTRSEPGALIVFGSTRLGQRLQLLGIQHDDGAVLETHPFA